MRRFLSVVKSIVSSILMVVGFTIMMIGIILADREMVDTFSKSIDDTRNKLNWKKQVKDELSRHFYPN